jgi:hypothetical protein
MIVASGEPEGRGLVLPRVEAGVVVGGCGENVAAGGRVGCVAAPRPRTEATMAAPVTSAVSVDGMVGEESVVGTVAAFDEVAVAGVARWLNQEKGTKESEWPGSLAVSVEVSLAGVPGGVEGAGVAAGAGVADLLSHSKSERGESLSLGVGSDVLALMLAVEAWVMGPVGDFGLKPTRLARSGVTNRGASAEEEGGVGIDCSLLVASASPVGVVAGATTGAPDLPSQA